MLLFAAAAIAIGAGRQPQIDVRGDLTAVAYGHENAVWFAGSPAYKPVRVGGSGKLMLGGRRGPRIAIADSAIVVSAIVDETLVAWRSRDNGVSWSAAKTINSVPRSAREGLHGMAARGDTVFLTWLDLRENRTILYGALSRDGGATWSANFPIYDSPDGHICECCHPSALVGPRGELYAMWRNWLGGMRDMWLGVSRDGGASWRSEKLGQGSWPLKACPMDGGGLALESDGGIRTVWRRDKTVYTAKPGAREAEIGPGRDPQISRSLIFYRTGEGLVLRRDGQTRVLSPTGTYGVIAGSVAAWEDSGQIVVQSVD
jgi:hypothetical protein